MKSTKFFIIDGNKINAADPALLAKDRATFYLVDVASKEEPRIFSTLSAAKEFADKESRVDIVEWISETNHRDVAEWIADQLPSRKTPVHIYEEMLLVDYSPYEGDDEDMEAAQFIYRSTVNLTDSAFGGEA